MLLGTTSIAKSEAMSDRGSSTEGGHRAQRAQRQAPRAEAEIITQAGRKGRVTVATNMAGRGTDIVLGGKPEALWEGRSASSKGLDRGRRSEAKKLREELEAQCKAEQERSSSSAAST